MNAEGDSAISDETLEGLGTQNSFLSSLFGSIIKLTSTPKRRPPLPPEFNATISQEYVAEASVNATMPAVSRGAVLDGAQSMKEVVTVAATQTPTPIDQLPEETISDLSTKFRLTDILPHTGYFAAGAIAGVVSRTCTAPLDRLKVYLIANIESAKSPVEAAKKGNAVKAVRHLGQPLIAATKELWAAGGVRSLFAGMCFSNPHTLQRLKLMIIGNGLNVLKVMPESAIRFGSFEAAKRAMAQLEGHGDTKQLNPYSKFLAGGIGGMASQ